MENQNGHRVLGGRYELLEVVGQGGMATVYKAYCQILERIVAVKILKDEFADNASFVEKFRTEAMAAARITHPNIVNVYDVGQDEGTYYIVMEYVEGQTLKKYIESQQVIPLSTAINIAIMICDGVQHAHENQVIHRDVKPQNILITSQGLVKVADFGIARANTTATITFNKDHVLGSVHYISPEQARGAGVSYATDIYSIGCILYEMCTGRLPFDAESPVTVALMHLHDEPIPPADINPQISPELEDIILHAMMKVPTRRFASAAEMGKELLNVSKAMQNRLIEAAQAAENSEQQVPSELTDAKISVLKQVQEDLGQTSTPEYFSASSNLKRDEKPKKKNPIGKIITFGIIFILLAFGAGIFSAFSGRFFGEEVSVPLMTGLSLEEAENSAAKLGLKLNVIGRETSDTYGEGIVISQKPEADNTVKSGREIKVKISSGLTEGVQQVVIEKLTGMSRENVEQYLINNGLVLGNIEEMYDSTYAAGTILSQTPSSGSSVALGTPVNLRISLGAAPDKIAVPSCVGVTLEEAQGLLAGVGLNVSNVTYEASGAENIGLVLSQSIDSGTMLNEGSGINLVVGAAEESVEVNQEGTAEPEDNLQSTTVIIEIPKDKSVYSLSVDLTDDHGTRTVVYPIDQNGGTQFSMNLNYYGSGTYTVYLDGDTYTTGTV